MASMRTCIWKGVAPLTRDQKFQARRCHPAKTIAPSSMPLPGETPEIDLTAEDVEEERQAEEAAKNRKKMGLPEVDPDSLPSASLYKFMYFG